MLAKNLGRVAIAAGIASTVLFGTAVGTASAAPPFTPLQVPVVTGPEIGPGGVPGGLFQTVAVTAAPGPRAGVTTFEVTEPAAYHYQYNYRWITVHWRNLSTGAAGTADLRHWVDKFSQPDEEYAATLPTRADVETGSGPVVATVTHQRQQWQAPPLSNAIVPGAGVIVVP